ncbi:MAG: circularly permuted type 2 ATP-grasp protein, partial [Hyphomicrobiaceae bacterium]
RRRLHYVQRQIHENGVTYNVYADPQGADRPWELDVLPLIISAQEWQTIENAIAQRAELLNRILADVYGEQNLLKEGRLPPALIFGHAGFLRPCHGMRPPGGIFLHGYAADLARSPDGRWWVIADRTQSPSGAGYALENRLVISRVFPDLFRDLRVHHLAGFFRTLQASLGHWAPHGDEPPLIVLLTPGPYNETYFEHAYLARYLGFPLVEGSDLTVRNGCVWLKSLEGLKRVHAILRRLDDDFSDPLELRGDSALGVPGLTQAARLGNVLIANALGASVLETSALLGYLPGLCEHLLGEALAMPSVATWWCGEEAALADALDKLDTLVIKGAFPQLRLEPVFGPDLNARQREELVANLRTHPYNYVAQELVQLSQAPVWDRGHAHELSARPVGMRVFAVASPNGYVVMPGGLTRVASDANVRMLSMQRGGSSKDTWVLSQGPVSAFSLLRRAIGPQDIVRSGANLSSRVVENLFWFGRYAERCDDTARLLRITLDRLFENGRNVQGTQWRAIIGLCRLLELLPMDPKRELEAHLMRAIVDAAHAPSLAANLRQLFRIAFHLRERLSGDNWRTINRMVQDLGQRQKSRDIPLGEAFAFLDRTVLALMTLAGFSMDGMTRDQGWRFLSLGRRIERLHFLSLTLRHALHAPAESDLEWLLQLADSIVTYRSRYMTRPERLPVFDLLLLDPGNPRSVIFQAAGIRDYVGRLADQYGPLADDPFTPLLPQLQAFDLPDSLNSPDGIAALSDLLARVGGEALALSDRIAQRFFSHVDASQRTFSL